MDIGQRSNETSLPGSFSETLLMRLSRCEPLIQYCPVFELASTVSFIARKRSGASWISSIVAGAGLELKNSSGASRAFIRLAALSKVTYCRDESDKCCKRVLLPDWRNPESITILKVFDAFSMTGSRVLGRYWSDSIWMFYKIGYTCSILCDIWIKSMIFKEFFWIKWMIREIIPANQRENPSPYP